MICDLNSLDRSNQDLASQQQDNFAQQLRDVIANIQITPDFTIVCADYEPLLVSPQYRSYLEQTSDLERDRYFTQNLQQYLYDIFIGQIRSQQLAEAKDRNKQDAVEKTLNCSDRWYETQFYLELTQSNHGQGYYDSNWLLVRQEAERWQVAKNGLTLYIIREQHLIDPTAKLEAGQTVSIRMPSSRIERGQYIAVGNTGSVGDRQYSLESNVFQLYFNVSSETALILLDCLTKELNLLQIPFDFKLPYAEANYSSSDAVILEFVGEDWQKIQPVIEKAYLENEAGFKLETPFFCQQLRSGLGLSKKPTSISSDRAENIGFQYCKIIAKTIIQSFAKNDNFNKLNSEQVAYNLQYLFEEGIKLEHFYLNYDRLLIDKT